MLSEKILDAEYLYRRVILNPNFWDFDQNRPSSAIFKDSKGISVDRQSDREDQEIIELYKEYPIRGIVKIQTAKCRYLDTYPIYKPVSDNLFHSEIHDSPLKIALSQSKAKKLRDASEIIFHNPL